MNDVNPRQLIILGGLLVVLVGAVAYSVLSVGGGGSSASAQRQTTAATPSGLPSTSVAEPIQLVEFEGDIDSMLEDIEIVTFNYQNERISRNVMAPLIGRIRSGTQVEDFLIGEGPNLINIVRKNVTGIIYDPVNPAAVVDNEIVYEGYLYPDGTTVRKIEPTRVVFEFADSEIPVEMEEF